MDAETPWLFEASREDCDEGVRAVARVAVSS